MNSQTIGAVGEEQARLIEIIKTPALLGALKELGESTEAQNAAALDPRAFLANRKVPLERDVEVTFTRKTTGSRGSISVCLSLGVISVCYNF